MDGEGEWSMIGLEMRAGPDDLRQFWQSKGFLLYSNSRRGAGVNFYFWNLFLAIVWRVDWELIEEVGENSWRLVQSPGWRWFSLGLQWWICRWRAGLHGRCTLEVGSTGLGDGWTEGVGGGVEMRRGLRFPTHTCELYLHFTRQTRPADSPVLTSLPFTLWITTNFLSCYFQYQGVYLLTSFLCIIFNHRFPATLPVFSVVSLSLLSSFCHVPSSFFCWHLLPIIQQIPSFIYSETK